ncbi:MAG: UxaA family hydrolase, partial [Burkholderiaceae bacterium]|nr:UxaA family hydrolase [Burkholderiaceae bacterium]
MQLTSEQKPLYIKMHDNDNVAIVVNDGGLPAHTVFPCALELVDHVPQGHKVALTDLPEGSAIRRYNVTIGYTNTDVKRGQWLNETLIRMPDARALDNLPIATVSPKPLPPLEG